MAKDFLTDVGPLFFKKGLLTGLLGVDQSAINQQNFQRFPHSLHSTKVVIGSSALRVWTWL